MSLHNVTSDGEFRLPISHETVSLADGPVSLYLGSTSLQLVDSERDLGLISSYGPDKAPVGYLVIDPDTFDSEQRTGFKGLRDGEEVVLGRGHTYDRFNFTDTVSREHVRLQRNGDDVEITDLGSTNGTLLARTKTPPDTNRQTHLAAAPAVEKPETQAAGVYSVAGESIPADYRASDPNEDTLFIDAANRTLAVFDGMGGHEGSAAASVEAATSVEQSLKAVPLVVPRSIAELAIREALEKAHDAIVELMLKNPGMTGIGTTAIIAKIFETESGAPYAMIGSVGDSRAYLIRNERIEDVTLDHVFTGLPTSQRRGIQETLAEATDMSKLSREEYALFRQRNMINSCLGGPDGSGTTISISDFNLQPGDRLLMTSDGIHDNLTSAEIEEAIAGADTDVAVADLVQAARRRSQDRSHARAKPDDMTAALLTYEA